MSAPAEFSRMIDARAVDGRQLTLVADTAECAALADRFALVRVKRLSALVSLTRDGPDVVAQGRLTAAIVQACAVSAEDLAVQIDVPLAFRFVPEGAASAEEVELSADQLDEIAYAGTHFDVGEAVAQGLGLAIDPYATGDQAEAARAAGLIAPGGGAFAALAALRKPE